jgi:hypothetical protein
MKVFGRVLLVALGTVVLVSGIQFAAEGSDYWLYRTFAPRREAVRREVFEQTKSYNEGMAQQLWDAQVEYAHADANGKAAIRSAVLHQVAGYDTERLPAELRVFVLELKADQLGLPNSTGDTK